MSADIRKDSIDIGIVTNDADAALGFYRDTIGLKQEGELELPFGTMYRLLAGSTVVKLVVPNDPIEVGSPPGGLTGATGIRYWTITVSNLDEVVSAAEAAGYNVPWPRRSIRAGVSVAMIEDPDGNWLELLELSDA